MTAGSGCGGAGEYDCAEEVKCEIRNDDGTSNGHCWGQCVHAPHDSFGFPMLVWTGPEVLAPSSCADLVRVVPGTGERIPFGGATVTFFARTVPEPTHSCPTCACTAPACALPRTVTAMSMEACREDSVGTQTSLLLPAGWDGSCLSPGTVPSEQLGWLSIDPAIWEPCVPIVADEPPRPLSADTGDIAIGCSGPLALGLCPGGAELCMLDQQPAHLPDGWRHCIVGEGELDCQQPEGVADPRKIFSDRLGVFYEGLVTAPVCTPCTCMAPETSRCEALLYTWKDAACSDMLVGIGVNEREGVCVDPVSGSTLASVSATWLSNEPGTCTPTPGEPTNVPVDGKAKTVCCLPKALEAP
ncbi:hypothetical protein [Sorangium sp. So ce131]|uniref:hypothetical protein n=1 Tax=Sorangium sp. So ce131 TaxID=3133282 RepID=UPI003F5D6CDA